jgi:hypothetical protein
MPRNNCDPAPTPPDSELGDQQCPKCGAEMEPIESHVAGLPLQKLQLCPACYLVMWSDQDGMHVRQGVSMGPSTGAGNIKDDSITKDGVGKGGVGAPGYRGHMVGEPTDC